MFSWVSRKLISIIISKYNILVWHLEYQLDYAQRNPPLLKNLKLKI